MAAARAFQILGTALLFGALTSAAHAGTFQVLHTFHGFPAGDGANPHAAPIMDNKGNLYGTTEAGGGSGCGVIYKLHKSRNGAWKETILYAFQCGDDGYGPVGGVIMDKAGNLYGGTQLGGTGECFFFGERIGCGAVYELSPGAGGTWTEAVLYSFPAPPGSEFSGPEASLIFDGKDQLVGTTVLDGACDDGSVFRLKLINGTWKERDIHTFCGNDGFAPGYGALARDAAGNLYGTTMGGLGTVFELSPLAHNKWAFNTLHAFTQDEGGVPEGGPTLDASGNLYGGELYGGLSGYGSIYELSPAGGGAWNESILYEFKGGGPDGQNPWPSPVFDSSDNLFGTTQAGGEAQYCINCGVIYELVPQGGGQWSESVVYSFGSQQNVADGADPVGGLVRGADGSFYGTTYEGGDPSCSGCGVVFEFMP